MLDITRDNTVDLEHINAVVRNLRYAPSFGDQYTPRNSYFKATDRLRNPFPGCEAMERSNGETFQDLFVITALKGKRDMRFLEIGAAEPIFDNNTYLLESAFGWTGISIDIELEKLKRWAGVRKARTICADAEVVNYGAVLDRFSDERDYGYLQLDCDNDAIQEHILRTFPFNRYRFATLTFEHNLYLGGEEEYRDRTRKLIQELGYVLIAPDVSKIGSFASYEDWYVHPNLVDMDWCRKVFDVPVPIDARRVFIE
jgi:hypothetical protein